jgi:hypothetical protein
MAQIIKVTDGYINLDNVEVVWIKPNNMYEFNMVSGQKVLFKTTEIDQKVIDLLKSS